MKLAKVVKDRAIRVLLGKSVVPSGLYELGKYFRLYGPIKFEHHQEGSTIVSVSTNFKYGSIVACGDTREKLDENVKDAILTSFEIPSSYRKEAAIVNEGELQEEYALAK